MTLAPDRLDRFARHIVLPDVGGAGQAKLVRSHVVLVGLGGIGSPALQYLAGAGIGRFTLIDDDVIEASNLQRQTIFTPAAIGRPKAEVAGEWLQAFDPAINFDARVARIDRGNAPARTSCSMAATTSPRGWRCPTPAWRRAFR